MVKHPNYVHTDQIWKDHVSKENYTARVRWPERYGHLTEEYRLIHRSYMYHPTRSSATIGCGTSIQQSPQVVKFPPIERAKSLKRVPLTTSKMIGWRSAHPDCQLERLGKYSNTTRRQKGSILNTLNWPREGAA